MSQTTGVLNNDNKEFRMENESLCSDYYLYAYVDCVCYIYCSNLKSLTRSKYFTVVDSETKFCRQFLGICNANIQNHSYKTLYNYSGYWYRLHYRNTSSEFLFNQETYNKNLAKVRGKIPLFPFQNTSCNFVIKYIKRTFKRCIFYYCKNKEGRQCVCCSRRTLQSHVTAAPGLQISHKLTDLLYLFCDVMRESLESLLVSSFPYRLLLH